MRLFKAARPERVHFHQLTKRTAPQATGAEREELASAPARRSTAAQESRTEEPGYTRVRQAMYVPEPERRAPAAVAEPHLTPARVPGVAPNAITETPRSEIVKGYEYAKDHYVVVEEEELKTITPQTGTEMQILEFVRLSDIDPLYFETSYYMSPDDAGAKAYALLYEAMRQTQYVAIAQVAMHRREHVVIVRPGPRGIVTHTMYYADEIRSELESVADTSAVNPKELALAKSLIETLAAPFEPNKYKDRFRENLQALLAAKMAGKTVSVAQPARTAAPVVNILDALQRSLAQAGRKPAAREVEPKPPSKSKQRAGGGRSRS